jgi:TonB-linked SusC/RagA family outer membrane protein
MKKNETVSVSENYLLYLKIVRTMKLIIALMLIACLQVSAKTWSQDKITLKMNEVEIKKVLIAIEKNSDYRFLFTDDAIKGKPRVSLDVVKASLNEVLDKILANTGVGYKVLGTNLVVIKENMQVADIDMKELRVSGKITSPAGEPLYGVSINVKGSTIGTTTDEAGNYSLNVPDNATLVFSYVGYMPAEEKVAGRTVINIIMQVSTQIMDQVVIVGYGTQRKRDLTGSVSSVKGEELEKMPSTNPIASLQGKVPGLTISNTGRAGASPVVRIRGVNSTNTASPVYVVDGIIQDNIDYLNPADIESIDILRDPSSIAVYGMRAANGVIAVTLKKAARGKTVINLQSSVSIQRVQDRIEITDAAGFKQLYTAQLANLNAAPFDYTNYTANTNWQDLVLRNAVMTSNNISISNSGEKTTTRLNIGYTNQEGVLKNDQYERFLVRLSEEIKLNKNIKVGGDVTGYHFISNPPAASITNALWAAPIVPIQVDEKTYYSMPSFQRAQVGNPMAALNRGDRSSVNKGYRVIGSLFAEVKFLKSFTWKSVVYGDFGFNTGRSYSRLPYSFVNLGEGAAPTTTTYDNAARTSVSQDQSEAKRFQQDHYLTFDKKFGRGHALTAVAGFTTQYEYGSSVSGTRRDTAINVPDDPDFWYLGIVNVNNPISNGGSGYERALFGSFVRGAYSYKGKYLLNATFRRDASSKLPPENRWASSGSLGLGWVVSDESFFDKFNGIDFLKLKASYGTVTNSNGVPDNVFQPGISNASTAIFGDNVYTSISAAFDPDPNLKFEVIRGFDVGFDARFLKNRLNVEFTRYNGKNFNLGTSFGNGK